MEWNGLFKGRSPVSEIAGLVLIWLAVAGCQSQAVSELVPSPSPVPTTAVESLKDSASRNSTVYVKGTVGAIVPLLEGTVYELQDGTGKVWIRTTQAPPKPGEAAIVRGTVRFESILINGQEQGSLYIEQK